MRKLLLPRGAVNAVYLPYLQSPRRYQIFFGGASSGKSCFLATRAVLDTLQGRSTLVIRQVARTLRTSCWNEIGKAAAKVTTAPQALELTYTGEAQALVSAGAAEGGTLVYSTTENGTYEETIPTGTDADTYKVWYKVEGDGTHSSTAPVELEVTIAPKALTAADITVAEIASTTYTGSDIEPTVMVKDGNKTLVNGTDYTVAYTDNRNAGTATVTITGEGN